MRTTTIVLAVTGMLVTGCGGDDSSTVTDPSSDDAAAVSTIDNDPVADPTGSATTADAGQASDDDQNPPTEATSAPAPESSGIGDNTAIVTIGDQQFEFDVSPGSIQRCDPNFFGAFWALATQQEGGLELLLPPEGDPNFEDPPTMKVRDDATDSEWIADPSTLLPGVQAGQSQIDTFTVDGNRATGTATLVEQNGAYAGTIEPVTGTFEVLCAPA